MEFAWLEDFITLAECGHFSRAAERRNISQSAFSRRVKLLEDWIGAPLFNRDTHRLYLTAAGEEFLPVAEEAVRRISSGRKQAKEAALSAAATVRIASTHALAMIFFPGWLHGLEERSETPPVISLVTDNMAGCERLFLEGDAQFLLCHYHPSTPVLMKPAYFQSIYVGDDVLVPVSAPNRSDRTALYSLPGSAEAPVPFLAYGPASGMGRILSSMQALDAPPAWLNATFTAHVAAVLFTMAKSGRGVAWLPLSLVQPAFDNGELVRAGSSEWDIPIQIRLYRPRARQSPVAEAFWALARDADPSRQIDM